MPQRKKILIILSSVAILFLVTTGLILPAVIQQQAIAWFAQNSERKLVLDNVVFNPFNGKLTLSGLRLSEAGSEDKAIAFSRLVIDVNISSVWSRALIVDRLQLFAPSINIVKLSADRFNFSDFLDMAPASPTPETKSEPLHFAISNFIIHGGALDFRDVEKPDVTHTVRDFDLALPFVGNTPALADKFVQPRLSLKFDDAPFAIEGEAKPFADTLEASLQIKLDDIDLPYYSTYLPRPRPVDFESGKVSVDLDLVYKVVRGGDTTLTLGGDVLITSLSVRDRKQERLIFLPLAQVMIAQADLLKQQAVIDEIAIYGLEVFADRNAAGELNFARLTNSSEPPSTGGGTPAVEEKAPPGESPHLQLAQFRLRNGVVHFRDMAGKTPFTRQLQNINVDVKNFDNLSPEASTYKVEMQISEPRSTRLGRVMVAGDFGLEPLRATAAIAVEKLQLDGIESYFPPEFAGVVADGLVDAALSADVQMSPQMAVGLGGNVGLRSLDLVEPVDNSDVLRWESLQLDGLELQLTDAGPPSIRIAALTLNSYLAKILVTKTGEINLQHMVAENKTPAETPDATDSAGASGGSEAPASPEAAEQPGEVAPHIAIGHITLQGGTLEFIDQHLSKPFKTKFLNLGGRITGIDSQAEQSASVDLRGNLENRSPLTITGNIQPLRAKLFADLKIRFDSIELSPMTPYSGNYLGYTIEKGKLYLNLDYQLDGSNLAAANHVFLDQFTFGTKVESEDATALPVRLAVALLKDGQGEIHLDLPVTGSLDDPEFSVIGVVFTILKNLLVKAATSPFKLLAAMIGGGEDFSTIGFQYGDVVLGDTEIIKLEKLADALRQRPALKVEVSGYVDKARDPEGYRRVSLERSLQQLKFDALKRAGKLPADASVNAMLLSDEERTKYLKQVYDKSKFPKPRNAIGLVKSLSDAEMEKLIIANTPAGDDEMQSLADARGRAVHEYLLQVAKLPVERVFLKQDDIYRLPDEKDASGCRVGFGATVD